MSRKQRPKPEEIFLKEIKASIRNLLIDNPNYKNDYYMKARGNGFVPDLLTDTKDRAKYILEKIDELKHLIDL